MKTSQFFGRKQGKALTKSRQEALDALLPKLKIQIEENDLLNLSDLFSDTDNQTWLEIGFGSGEHCTGLLDQHPNVNLIAVEPFVNGMAAFLKDLQQKPEHHDRCRVFMDDALLLVGALPDQSIDRLYILNPDPWHKKRHHKRRIVRPETLNEYARILKPGTDLIMSTDVPYLAEWMVTHTFNHPAFEWMAASANDWREKPKDWIDTRYQTKGAKGADQMVYLMFKRV
ncbi:MAG: tRNA (guanine(46)-N(7))-methyltransferase TrmB [Pseudomonadota bacterium]